MTLRLTPLASAARWDPPGVFDQPPYLAVAAAHDRSTAWLASVGATSLPLLRDARGLRTVYGYPQPSGPGTTELAVGLAASAEPVRIQLADIGPARALVAALRSLDEPTEVRPLCATTLDGKDPLQRLDRRAARAVSTSLHRGARVTVGVLEPWFGAFYRQAMNALGADAPYLFDDDYFVVIAALDSALVTVHDEHGVAAATIWLFDRRWAFYHLGARRQTPPPVLGAMNLALLEGMRESTRRGLELAMLGGGRGSDEQDGLLRFKRQMADRLVARVTFAIGEDVPQ